MSLDSLIQALATRVATECKSLRTAIGVAAPPGVINPYAGSAAPSGWLMCDGSAVSRTTYAALFAAIGTAFGAGDGTTTFNLPDTRARGLIGVGTGKALGASDGIAEGSRNAEWSHAHGHTASTTIVAASAGTPAGTIGDHAAHSHGNGSLTTLNAGGFTTTIGVGVSDHADHQHYIASSATGAGGSHRHGINGQANATSYTFASGSTTNKNVPALGDFNGHAHGGNTDYEAVHTHAYGNQWTGSQNPATSVSHSVSVTQFVKPDHAHSVSGNIGTETVALSHAFVGTAMTAHGHSASTTVNSGDPGNHPFLAVNHIIKT